METRARDVIAGALRPNDPRRFLVEAMIGAMAADGKLDEREEAVLKKHLDEHEMFAGLSSGNQKLLLELANDAVKFAGSAIARVPAMAKGLPARLHRVAAMSMACEIVVADDDVDQGELAYLENLRLALRIAPYEAQDIFAAAKEKRALRYLDDRLHRLRSLVPVVVEMFTLRASTVGKVTDVHRFELKDFLVAIPDMALRDHEIEGLLYQAFKKSRSGAGVEGELTTMAQNLPDPVDRYWMVVYALCAEPISNLARWRFIPFLSLLQRIFQIGDSDMELAATDAAGFPANLPRPRS